jgi:hypothetical protein
MRASTPATWSSWQGISLAANRDAASLVTATVGVDGVATAFADLANPERHTKIIVQPWR